MNTRVVGRPEPDEIPSHYVGYIKRVPELDPVVVCAAQIEETVAMLRGLSEAAAMYLGYHSAGVVHVTTDVLVPRLTVFKCKELDEPRSVEVGRVGQHVVVRVGPGPSS